MGFGTRRVWSIAWAICWWCCDGWWRRVIILSWFMQSRGVVDLPLSFAGAPLFCSTRYSRSMSSLQSRSAKLLVYIDGGRIDMSNGGCCGEGGQFGQWETKAGRSTGSSSGLIVAVGCICPTQGSRKWRRTCQLICDLWPLCLWQGGTCACLRCLESAQSSAQEDCSRGRGPSWKDR